MSPELNLGRPVATSIGPPVALRARGPGREFSQFSAISSVVPRVSPSVRHFDSAPSTLRSFQHSRPVRTFESPRIAAREGLRQRDAQHLLAFRPDKQPSLAHDVASGAEPLARLVRVEPVRAEVAPSIGPKRRLSRDFIQPKIATGNAFLEAPGLSLQSPDQSQKPGNQEIANDQNGSKVAPTERVGNTSKKPIVEYKKYPIQASSLAEIFSTTQGLVMAPRPGVLDKRVAEIASLARVKNVVIENNGQADVLLNTAKNLPTSLELEFKVSKTGSEILRSALDGRGESTLSSETVHDDKVAELSGWPKLTVEANRALELEGKDVKILAKPAPVEARVAEIPVSLDPINDTQLVKTFEALLPALGQEMALQAMGKSVEQRLLALNPAQKLALAEKIIAESEPEELLKNLTEAEKWRVEIFVRKIVRERQTNLKAVVWEPGMRARRQKIRSVLAQLKPGEVISGAEFVSRIGAQTPDEIGPINPKGYTSGGGDEFRRIILDGEYTKADEGYVIGVSEDNPTLEVVEEEIVSQKEATAEQVYVELNKRLPEIIAFAKQRAMVMLASLPIG